MERSQRRRDREGDRPETQKEKEKEVPSQRRDKRKEQKAETRDRQREEQRRKGREGSGLWLRGALELRPGGQGWKHFISLL